MGSRAGDWGFGRGWRLDRKVSWDAKVFCTLSRGGPRQQAATDCSRAPDLLTAPPSRSSRRSPASIHVGSRRRRAAEAVAPSPASSGALPPRAAASPCLLRLPALPASPCAAASRWCSRVPHLPVPPNVAAACSPSASAPSRPGPDPDRPAAALALTRLGPPPPIPKKNYKRLATRGTKWGSPQKKAKGGMQSTVSTRSKAANPATNTRSKMGKLN
ncbi:hypothetical protein ZWY2020_049304 [Hordeum vulgare]|nr:hypothetical protein ZWY2020_049304 [Hordeum vulgare]